MSGVEIVAMTSITLTVLTACVLGALIKRVNSLHEQILTCDRYRINDVNDVETVLGEKINRIQGVLDQINNEAPCPLNLTELSIQIDDLTETVNRLSDRVDGIGEASEHHSRYVEQLDQRIKRTNVIAVNAEQQIMKIMSPAQNPFKNKNAKQLYEDLDGIYTELKQILNYD